MTTDTLVTTFKSQKLFGMAEATANLNEQASPTYLQSLPVLETLLKAEVPERDLWRLITLKRRTNRSIGPNIDVYVFPVIWGGIPNAKNYF